MILFSVQSLTRPSCPVVGSDLDKKISFGVPRYVGGMFFSWTLLFCLCIRTGWSHVPSACAFTKDGRLESQAKLTSTLTTVFTAFTSFGLTAVSAWFASERYIFLRHSGRKWLSDALMEYEDMIMKFSGFRTLNGLLHNLETRISRMNELLRRFSSKFLKSKPLHDLETGTLPIAHHHDGPPSSEVPQSPSRLPLTTEPPETPRLPQAPSVVLEKEPASPISPGKELWKNAFRTVKMHTSISSPYGMTSVVGQGRETLRRQTNSSSDLASGYHDQRKWTEEAINVLSRSRAALLRPRLFELEPVHDLAAHSGLVRHLQFSPNGKYLATSRYLHLQLTGSHI